MRKKWSVRNFVLVWAAVSGSLALTIDASGQRSAGAIVAVDETVSPAGASARSGAAAAQTKSTSSAGKSSSGNQGGGKAKGKKPKKAAAPKPAIKHRIDVSKYNGPVLGDKYTFLNFEVISAAKPTHTIIAKNAGASGLVQVEILVGENGSVLNARARTGNKLLWDEAERAALASRFNRPGVNGQPARALGFLVYRFGPAAAEDDD